MSVQEVLQFLKRKSKPIEDVGYGMVTKSTQPDKQYTFGLLYKATNEPESPVLDAHNEWVTGDVLQDSQWSYVKSGDRRIWLQHKLQGAVVLGEWVDIVTWPFEVKMALTTPGGGTHKASIPPNSVFMGVLWNSVGWDLVKRGLIRGFSLGGMARRKRN